MLAPDRDDVNSDLADTHNLLLRIGGYATTCLTALIGQMPDPPQWLSDVNAVLSQCRSDAHSWLQDRPDIIVGIIDGFSNYSSLIDSVAASSSSEFDAAGWIALLTSLRDQASANSAATRAAADRIGKHGDAFAASHAKLRDVLAEARAAQDADEADILKVSVDLAQLHDRLDELDSGTTGAAMSGGEAAIKTVAQITYAVLIAGETAVPYVGLAVMLFSVGESLYETIEGDSKISSILSQIEADTRQLDADVRLLALIHSLLAVLDNINDAYAAASQRAPRLDEYWEAAAADLDLAVDAIHAGAVPADMLALATLPKAAAVWRELASTASAMMEPAVEEPRAAELKIVFN